MISEQTLSDGIETFMVSVRESEDPSKLILFAVGAGGNPERYFTILELLVQSGYTVVAPHFKRLASLSPTKEELILRARRNLLP